ncbi:MAG: PorV/PorQ family protein [Candidatus Krumholzibacteriota bacterium]|nr:PorV/PorQ family protein [Candidatus Krumholzibacteriota bacterium]
MKRTTVIACALLFVFSAGARADKYAGEFMALGGGARAMAMGGAFTSIADDATAVFWNPAGIAGFSSLMMTPNDYTMSFMHSERFGSIIDYNFFSAVFPLKAGESSWGVSVIHMGIDDIRIIPIEGMIGNSDGDDRFEPWLGENLTRNYADFPLESVNDFAFFLSYGQKMSFGDIGGSVKIIRNDQVTGVSSFGIGVDLGIIKRDLWRNLSVGAKLQDATGTYISWSTGKREFIYPALKVGMGYPIHLQGMGSVLLFSVDGDFRYENMKGVSQFWIGRASADFHLGGELMIRDLVSLRGGYDMGRPTAGIGVLLNDFGPWNISMGIDYALLLHDWLDTTHRVSLMIAH